MKPAASALVAEFETSAKAVQEAEAELRRKMAEDVARLERQRAFAYRRTRLVRVLATAADEAAAETEEAVAAAQARRVRDELGWTGDSEAYGEILRELQPVGRAVWQCSCGAEGATAASVNAELERFERWFERARGKSFYALFDQYFPEVPVVDF